MARATRTTAAGIGDAAAYSQHTMRTHWDVLNARTLGALALPDACERCFWLHQKIGAPDFPFPGIFSSIDSYSKKVLQAAWQQNQSLPHWFRQFGLDGEPLSSIHHSWFKIATGHGSLQLCGTPDEILQTHDGKLIIIDYKTARFKVDDSYRPMYEVQLNVYARIAENLKPSRRGYPFPCSVQTLGLMYYDPLTEVDDPNKITTRGFLMEFHAHWVPIERCDKRIDELLARVGNPLATSPTYWQCKLQNLPSVPSNRRHAAVKR